MDLSFYPLTLDAFDALSAESLCLFVASDERPLTGLAGLADWRLSGRLSKMLRAGLLTGDAGEALLTQPGPRLGFKKMFLFGVGPADQAEDKLTETVLAALRKIQQAGVTEAATHLPSHLSVEGGIRSLIDQIPGAGRAILFGADSQKPGAGSAPRGEVAKTTTVRPTRSVTPPQVQRVLSAPRPVTPPQGIPVTAVPASGDDRRPAPPPPQRYIPVEPRQNVFDRKRKK